RRSRFINRGFHCFTTWRCCPSFLRVILSIAVPLLSSAFFAHAEGMVSNCTQADLSAALKGGGLVTFSCDGTIGLTNTITISTNNATGCNGGGGTFSDDVSGGSASGGAIYGTNARIILISTGFSSNSASGGAPGGFGPNVGGPSGGAYGGSVSVTGGQLSIS